MNFIYVIHLMCWNYLIALIDLITHSRNRNNRNNSGNGDNNRFASRFRRHDHLNKIADLAATLAQCDHDVSKAAAFLGEMCAPAPGASGEPPLTPPGKAAQVQWTVASSDGAIPYADAVNKLIESDYLLIFIFVISRKSD